jgi:putative component of membrane protein insertase Oxa1/YidC/SpoIIIJ protein YidD
MNGAIFHQKCVCHILNLVVKAGLKTEAVKLLIIKFKDALNHIVSNQERKQRFALMCVNYGLSKLRVYWDIDTHWNSTYRFLHRCLPYHAVIEEFLRSSTPEGMTLEPSVEEWEQLERLRKFLETFFKATVQLSCSYSPTSFELLKHLYSISKMYRKLEQAETQDKSLTPIVDAMKQKFLKY